MYKRLGSFFSTLQPEIYLACFAFGTRTPIQVAFFFHTKVRSRHYLESFANSLESISIIQKRTKLIYTYSHLDKPNQFDERSRTFLFNVKGTQGTPNLPIKHEFGRCLAKSHNQYSINITGLVPVKYTEGGMFAR